MLLELSARNLALIEDVRVELRHGYCAWTGETGAGKSLLLTAMGLVTGQKGSAELVRDGRDEARVAAVFDVSEMALRSDVETILDAPLEDDQLIITRRINAQGRTFAHVNGMPANVATLRQLGARLLDIHGQHETLALLDPEKQRIWLDAYGGIGQMLTLYRAKRDAHDALRRRRKELLEMASQRQRELDLLRFELDELTAANPKAGEYAELAKEAHCLANAQQLRDGVNQGYQWLYEADRSAQELIERAARGLRPLAKDVPELETAINELDRLAEDVREVAYQLRGLGRSWNDDPERLEEIESRLATYRRLASRFRCEPDHLAVRRDLARARLETLERCEEDLQSLDKPLADSWIMTKQAASELTAARRKIAKAFAKQTQAHMKELALSDARLTVEIRPIELSDDPNAESAPENGADTVEIVFAPNPGETPRPLRKIASGGELSRVTLAIKTVLADVDQVPTLVFDEIDTGVGGRLGAVLGRKLSELARRHQVICVTHLPQMASFAQHQWVIRKQTVQGRTRTTITALDESERVEELAAMLRGDSVADGTRVEVQSMLAEARALSAMGGVATAPRFEELAESASAIGS